MLRVTYLFDQMKQSKQLKLLLTVDRNCIFA